MKELTRGLMYSFVGKYSNILISLVINSILARLISPEEYGVLAIVMTFITLFSNFLEMGWGSAIIQKKDINQKFISSIFYINIFFGLAIGMIFYFFSYYFISIYYKNIVYRILGRYMFFYLFFISLGIVPKALLYRQKKFKEIALISLISNFISGIIGILLAFKNFSYYSLIWQGVFSNIFIFILSWKISKIKIILFFSFKELKSMVSYSNYTFLFSFINYFSRNLDNILIGRYMGIYSLGIYDKAYKLMLYPLSILTNVISPVLHPVLARFQDDKEKIYFEYMKIVKILSCLGVLISIISFFSSREIILILYGEKWKDVIPIFKILSACISIQIVLSSSGTIFLASGKSDKLFFTGIINSSLMVTIIILGIKFNNLYYLSYMLFLAFLLNFFVAYYILIKKVLEKDFFKFLKEFLYPVYILIYLIFINRIYSTYMYDENILISFLKKIILNFSSFLIIVKILYLKKMKLKEIIKILKKI